MKRGSLLLSCAALLLVLACTANRAYRLAQAAEDEGNWDRAVIHYLELVDQFPNRVAYRTGLLRAKIRASQEHFERAREISEDRNLMVPVLMAQHYARNVFDQELHDELLTTVRDADADYSGYKLINALAKRQADQLLAESDEFF